MRTRDQVINDVRAQVAHRLNSSNVGDNLSHGEVKMLLAEIDELRSQRAMALRDHFAGLALPKCLEESWGEDDGMQSAVLGAYQIADAMLRARSKEEP